MRNDLNLTSVGHGQKPVKGKEPIIGIALTGPVGKLTVGGVKAISPVVGFLRAYDKQSFKILLARN